MFKFILTVCPDQTTHMYSHTCVKGSPKGRTKFACLRQVTLIYRFIAEYFGLTLLYSKKPKLYGVLAIMSAIGLRNPENRWSLNRGDHMSRFDCSHTRVYLTRFALRKLILSQ